MRVSVLAYNGCLAAEIFGFAELLLMANRIADTRRAKRDRFKVNIVGARGGNIRTANGTLVVTQAPPRDCDFLVVPAFHAPSAEELDRALARLAPEIALIARFGARCEVAAICGGAFLTGEAGLLDGKRTTTAWAFCAELSRRYPSAIVDPDALLVQDGAVRTTGAFSAGGDLALRLVRERFGEAIARALAKLTLLDCSRTSQAPYADARLAVVAHRPFSAAVEKRLLRDLTRRYSLKALSDAFHGSTRTMLRRFANETGQSPLEALQYLRIGRAKSLLEQTTLTLQQVAERVGYLDVSTFSRLFTRKVGMAPAMYRRQFR